MAASSSPQALICNDSADTTANRRGLITRFSSLIIMLARCVLCTYQYWGTSTAINSCARRYGMERSRNSARGCNQVTRKLRF
jgi:hypothetical protein